MNHADKLDYIEYPAKDFAATKAFFEQAFDWKFTDYGPDYMAFDRQGLEGGFYRSENFSRTDKGAALAIFYSISLETTKEKILKAGGIIHKDTYSFPGGRRFHFLDPNGNEFAVWTDKI